MDNQSTPSDIYEDELIRLVSSSSDTSTQYVIFRNIDDNFFAINVAKVEELIQNKNLLISKSSNQNSIVTSIAKIRDDMVTLIDFDKWLNPDTTSNPELHKLIILCYYAKKRIGIIIKDVVGIQSIESNSMYEASSKDEKTSYVVELSNTNKTLCNIFDSEQLLADIFPEIDKEANSEISKSVHTKATNKLILVAEDSKLIQIPISKLLKQSHYNYEIYDNGKLMLERLESLDADEVGLIITDIEMPVMDGMQMLEEIQKNDKYNKLPSIVHTNMVNTAIIKKANELGALEVTEKMNLIKLNSLIVKYSIK